MNALTIVTGATSGIGLATAQRLAAGGNPVILVGRDPARTDAAAEQVRAGTDTHVGAFLADLASQQEIRRLGAALRTAIDADGLTLGALVHSAGVYSSHRTPTVDGLELTFAVNHLAPFLLTHELLAAFDRRSSPRVVIVGSNAHRGISLDPQQVARPRRYQSLRAYKQSKLANELFVRALAPRLSAVEGAAYAVDPGLVDTAIGTKHSGVPARLVWRFRRRLGTPPDVPARTIAALATGTIGDGESGTTWRDGRRIEPSDEALDARLARELWEASCALCGIAEWPDPTAALSPAASAAPR